MSAEPTAIRDDSRLELVQFLVHHEPGQDPLIGHPVTSRYMEVDPLVVDALRLIQAGATPGQARQQLAQEKGVEVDVLDLLERFRASGFVLKVDDELAPQEARRRGWQAGQASTRTISATRWLTHPAAAWFVVAAATTWLVALSFAPAAMPSHRHFFITGQPLFNMFAVLAGFLAIAFIHEMGHYWMAKAYGLTPRLSIGHRFYLIILHTDVTDSWRLTPNQRLRIFLAGPSINILIGATATVLSALALKGHAVPVTWLPVLLFLQVANLYPLVFQLFLFARTDLYHVLQDATRQRNLAADSVSYLKFLGYRLISQIRTGQDATCQACGHRCMAIDPFCFGCGQPRRVTNPNASPFTYRQRYVLPIFGVLYVAASAIAYAFVALTFFPYIASIELFAVRSLIVEWSNQSGLGIATATATLLLATAQLAVVGYFVLKTLATVLGTVARVTWYTVIAVLVRVLPKKALATMVEGTLGIAVPVLNRRNVFAPVRQTPGPVQATPPRVAEKEVAA